MADADDVKDALADNATGPSEMANSQERAKQHPLPDQIEVAKFLAATEGTQRGKRGFRMQKIVPPGTD